MREYRGGCHCGALGVSYRTDLDPMYWSLRHDGCSFCRRHGVVGTSDPAGELSVKIADPSQVRYYRFAHRTADFLICGKCGVFVAAVTDTEHGKRAVLNARVLDGVSLNWASVADVRFDDESPTQRAERRSLHWTPVVIDLLVDSSSSLYFGAGQLHCGATRTQTTEATHKLPCGCHERAVAL